MDNKWGIGDVVICINDRNIVNNQMALKGIKSPIKEGLKYVINDIRICPTCGMMEFKISVPFTNEMKMVCVACKTDFEKEILDTWWCEHWRFKKEEKKENINISFKTKEIVKDIEIISN